MAFTQYGEPDTLLDPTYGELIFNHYKWGPSVGENGTYGSTRERLQGRSCSKGELGLETDSQESVFLPIFKDSIQEVQFYHKKFVCAERQDLTVQGDFSSNQASLFNV